MSNEVVVKKSRSHSVKADKIIRKLERKCWINHEICKELSKRNATLKKSQEQQQQTILKMTTAISEFCAEYKSLSNDVFEERLPDLRELDLLVSKLVQASWREESSDIAPQIDSQRNDRSTTRSKRQSIIMNAPGTSLLRKSINHTPDMDETTFESVTPIKEAAANIQRETYRDCSKVIPLFEHFLVVGAPVEEANEVASVLQALESQTISSRLKKTIDGIFSSPVFGGTLLQGNSAAVSTSENKANQSSSYFGFSRNRGRSVDHSGNNLPNAPTSVAVIESDLETEMNVEDSSSMKMKTLFSSPSSLFLMKSRSGKEIDKRVSENQGISQIDTREQQEFENFVDLLCKQEEQTPDRNSPTIVLAADEGRQIADNCTGENGNPFDGACDDVETKLSPKSDTTKDSSFSKIADNTNRSLQTFTSGFMAGSSVIKSNAGTAWSKLGGAFLSKLSPVTSSQSPNAKSGSGPVTASAAFTSTDDDATVSSSSSLSQIPSSAAASSNLISSDLDVETGLKVSAMAPIESKEVSILNKDLKSGNFLIPPKVLLRYPDNIDPPPIEVCDFCMPTGAKLHYLSSKEEDNSIQDILFGNTHNKRSGRSFVFLLEDKTIDSSNSNQGEIDIQTDDKIGRLYGICVLHPRLLRTNVVDQNKKIPLKKTKSNSVENGLSNESENAAAYGNSFTSGLAVEKNVEFESLVCYAFITRFPFFDFFFQILYDIIALEKLKRIELTNDLLDTNFENSKDFYEYLPSKLLLTVLEKLSKFSPDSMIRDPFGRIQLDEGLKPIELSTLSLSSSFNRMSDEESLHYLSNWCLTTLFSWVPADLLVWCLSLLLLECKIIVIGQEAGLISSVVLGLVTLLKPLRWVAPVIPMLPTKLFEFTESPVPILAGVLVDPMEASKFAASLFLKKCSESMEDVTTAVFDLTRVELSVCVGKSDSFSNLSLPQAYILMSSIENKLKASENVWNDFSVRNTHHQPVAVIGNSSASSSDGSSNRNPSLVRPIYHPTQGHKADASSIHELISDHLQRLCEQAKGAFLRSRLDQQKLEEQLTRLSFSSQLSSIAEQETDFYFSDSDSDFEERSESSSGAGSEDENEELKPSPAKEGRSLGGNLKSFYGKMIQSDGMVSLKLENRGSEVRDEDKLRLLRSPLVPHSLHRLSISNLPSHSNQKEFFQRFQKTQLFQDYLHQNQIDD